jgi:hypothetical protein
MSILYGNVIAVDAARKGAAYPSGAQLADVIWKLREDEHWYGANVPDSLIGMNTIHVGAGTGHLECDHYVGSSLRRVAIPDSSDCHETMKSLIRQRISVMP